MGSIQQWDTLGTIAAAKDNLVNAMPGWEPPAAHGVVLVPRRSMDSAEVRMKLW